MGTKCREIERIAKMQTDKTNRQDKQKKALHYNSCDTEIQEILQMEKRIFLILFRQSANSNSKRK